MVVVCITKLKTFSKLSAQHVFFFQKFVVCTAHVTNAVILNIIFFTLGFLMKKKFGWRKSTFSANYLVNLNIDILNPNIKNAFSSSRLCYWNNGSFWSHFCWHQLNLTYLPSRQIHTNSSKLLMGKRITTFILWWITWPLLKLQTKIIIIFMFFLINISTCVNLISTQ